jgi:hypothetical protein
MVTAKFVFLLLLWLKYIRLYGKSQVTITVMAATITPANVNQLAVVISANIFTPVLNPLKPSRQAAP